MSSVALPLVRAVRLPLVAAAAGAAAGLVGLGGGLRLAMRLVAVLNPDGVVFTENGELVGEITLSGTVSIVGAGGVVGTALGLVYAVVRGWLPRRGALRGLLYGALLAAAFGTPLLVDGENIDFALLEGDAIAVAALLACPILYGAGLGAIVDRLAPGGPRVLERTAVRVAGTLLVAVVVAAGLVRLVGALTEIAGR